MIPVKLNAGPDTNVIIAGDPKQLGPITRSPIAERLGLNISWLDRLMASPIYEPQRQNGITYDKADISPLPLTFVRQRRQAFEELPKP